MNHEAMDAKIADAQASLEEKQRLRSAALREQAEANRKFQEAEQATAEAHDQLMTLYKLAKQMVVS